MSTVTEVPAMTCPSCAQAFQTRPELDEHRRPNGTWCPGEVPRETRMAAPIVCPDCGLEFRATQALGRHRAVRRGQDLTPCQKQRARAAKAAELAAKGIQEAPHGRQAQSLGIRLSEDELAKLDQAIQAGQGTSRSAVIYRLIATLPELAHQ